MCVNIFGLVNLAMYIYNHVTKIQLMNCVFRLKIGLCFVLSETKLLLWGESLLLNMQNALKEKWWGGALRGL